MSLEKFGRLAEFGSLADPEVQKELARAQQSPEKWTVYLVPERGDERSNAQNRLYRRLLMKFAQQQGRDVEYWHELLVKRFLGYREVKTEDGDWRRVLCSTADLSVPEMTEFLNACLTYAGENQVH